jgi:hypothetical protein
MRTFWLNCFSFNFLTLAGSNCPFFVFIYSIYGVNEHKKYNLNRPGSESKMKSSLKAHLKYRINASTAESILKIRNCGTSKKNRNCGTYFRFGIVRLIFRKYGNRILPNLMYKKTVTGFRYMKLKIGYRTVPPPSTNFFQNVILFIKCG